MAFLSRTIGIVVFVAILYYSNWNDVIVIIGDADVNLVTISLTLVILLILLKCWRWYLLLEMQGVQYDVSFVVLDFLSSIYMGSITPGRLGEFVRVFYQKRHSNISTGMALSNILVDRLLDLGILLAVVSIGIFGYRSLFSSEFIFWMDIFLYFGCPVIILGSIWLYQSNLYKEIVSNMYAKFSSKSSGLFRFSIELSTGITNFFQLKIMLSVLVSIVAFFILVWLSNFLAQSLSIDISVTYLAFCVASANLIALLPVSILGIGTRDATILFLFGSVNISPELSLSFSLLFLFTLYLPGLLLGVFAWYVRSVLVKYDKLY